MSKTKEWFIYGIGFGAWIALWGYGNPLLIAIVVCLMAPTCLRFPGLIPLLFLGWALGAALRTYPDLVSQIPA